jgi:hypothetical protein
MELVPAPTIAASFSLGVTGAMNFDVAALIRNSFDCRIYGGCGCRQILF